MDCYPEHLDSNKQAVIRYVCICPQTNIVIFIYLKDLLTPYVPGRSLRSVAAPQLVVPRTWPEVTGPLLLEPPACETLRLLASPACCRIYSIFQSIS